MDKLPTLEQIKRQAKKLRKETGISHTQALDTVAKKHGFANWINCQRSLKEHSDKPIKTAPELFHLTFTDWLKKHVNRDSPLGDLAVDMSRDNSWPNYDSVEEYRDYLERKRAVYEAIETLERAWKTYKAYLKRKNSPIPLKPTAKKVSVKKHDERKITFVKNVKPIHFRDRDFEKFIASNKAWISWNGSKAIPVTVIDVDQQGYSVRLERPLFKLDKSTFSLRLDEVRSTPELACANMVM